MSDYIRSNINNKLITLKDLTTEPGAIGILSDFKDHTDPKYIGPGTWNVIHRRAFKARTHDQQIIFIDFMKEICYGFPCTVCKGHCTEYIKNHPMEEYLDILIDINGERMALGLFVWSWKFHNAVNARIKKPIMSWDTAYNLYSDTESLVCSKNCLESDNISHSELDPVHKSIYENNGAKPSTNINNTFNNNKLRSIPKIPEFKITSPVTQTSSQPFRLISVTRKS
jgi:hypothetical protein